MAEPKRSSPGKRDCDIEARIRENRREARVTAGEALFAIAESGAGVFSITGSARERILDPRILERRVCRAHRRMGPALPSRIHQEIPIGFYVRTAAPIARGAFVTVRAADVAPAAARARNFEGPRDRFIKRIAAVAGDRVCAEGDALTINDGPPMSRRTHDSTGAELSRWNGCRALGANEVLLLGDAEHSFDGRYWGPIDRRLIEGVWRPL